MVLHLLIFLIALSALLYSARLFTSSAEKIGLSLRLPSFVIGVFIIGIGTSLPELIAGVFSVVQENSEILPGNVIGATVSNLLLVTGFSILLSKNQIELKSKSLNVDLQFLMGSVFVFAILAYDGTVNWTEGVFSLVLYGIYVYYLLNSGASSESKSASVGVSASTVLLLLFGGIGIFFSADYTISSLSSISISMGIPSEIVALTILSLGTTLPEIVVNMSAVKQGKFEMALGSVLGSCIFNLTVIPGIGSFLGEIHVSQQLIEFPLPILGGSVLLFYLLAADKKMSKFEGAMFVLIYFLFVVKTVSSS